MTFANCDTPLNPVTLPILKLAFLRYPTCIIGLVANAGTVKTLAVIHVPSGQ